MIKNLLEPDEKQPEEIKVESEGKTADASAVDENFESYFAGIESPPSGAGETENLSEISDAADDELIFTEKPAGAMPARPPAETSREPFDFSEPRFNQPENSFAKTMNYEPLAETAAEPTNDKRTDDEPLIGFPVDEINFDLPGKTPFQKPVFNSVAEISNEMANSEPPFEIAGEPANYESSAETKAGNPPFGNSGLLFQSSAEPESFGETARKSGLAYAAAVTLFASVVFMLIIGWFADLLLGSSPWGIVVGIVLGAAIGFFQFVRLTSQIFKDRK